jgi:hypothetical protein
MKAYGRVDAEIHIFFNSALVGGAISFRLRPLYPWGKRPQYPLDRKLGGKQSQSGRREMKILEPTGT